MTYRIIVLLLAVLLWGGFYLTGTETHATDGIIFFGLVGAEGLLIWLQSRKEKPELTK